MRCMICRRTLNSLGSLRRISGEDGPPAYACDDHKQEATNRFSGEHGVAKLHPTIVDRMARTLKKGDWPCGA